MIEIIKELNIEVSKPNIFQAVVAKQYDMNTRFIKATFVDGNDVIKIPSDPTVRPVINAERPDGLSKGFDGVVNEDGSVTVPLHSWMLELEGKVICDISIIDTEADDNKKLTTTSFTLLVEKAAYGGDDVTNDPQYDVLVSLLETCSEAEAVAQEALKNSNEANSKYDACVEATENATAVVGEFNDIKQEIEDGGFIRSIEEINKGLILRFWIGTRAEYDALTEKPQDCYVIITDDTTVADINAKIAAIAVESEEHPGCWYRTVDGEIEWLNPPMVEGTEYRTTERYADSPVYVQRVSLTTTTAGNFVDYFIAQAQDDQDVFIVDVKGILLNDQDHYSHHPFPVISDSGSIAATAYVATRSDQDTDNIMWYLVVKTLEASVAQYTAHITVKYTKS